MCVMKGLHYMQSSQLSCIVRESHAFQQNLTLSLTVPLNSRKINKILLTVSIAPALLMYGILVDV